MKQYPASRPPAVAGLFYPAAPEALEAAVSDLMLAAPPQLPPAAALIVPHAGYVYSGPTAAQAYAHLPTTVRRVVLLGPAHHVALHGVAVPSAEAFVTPLGPVPVDRQACDTLARHGLVATVDEAHAPEHSLEVQLPFLQMLLDDFSIVPLVVGRADPGLVAEIVEMLWTGPETLIVVSTDLSHYHDYQTASRLDAATSAAIEAVHPDEIGRDSACGRIPLKGLLEVVRKRHLGVQCVDLHNSGDTAGDRKRVVGYGAYVVS